MFIRARVLTVSSALFSFGALGAACAASELSPPGAVVDGGSVDGAGDASTPLDGARDAGLFDIGSPLFDSGPSVCSEALDIVFVVDVSTTMSQEIASVRAGLVDIWRKATELSPSPRLYLAVFVDSGVLVNHCAPFASVDDLSTTFEEWRFLASSNYQLDLRATSQTCPENPLDVLHDVATECPWRTPATRIAVLVTDADFREAPFVHQNRAGSGETIDYPVRRTYAETLEALRANQVRVAAFAPRNGENDCDRWGSATAMQTGRGYFEPFGEDPPLAEGTGGRAYSIQDVRDGEVDLVDSINAMVETEYCTLY